RLGLQRIRGNCGRRGMLLHGVAFLSWNQHPEPKGSRRATPLLPFQHSSGQPPNLSTNRQRIAKLIEDDHLPRLVTAGVIRRMIEKIAYERAVGSESLS